MCLDKIFRLNTMLKHVTEHEVIVLDSLDCTLGLEYPKVFAISLVLKHLAMARLWMLHLESVFLFFSVQENFLALRRVRGLYPSQKSLYTGSSIFCLSLYIIAVVISCIPCQKDVLLFSRFMLSNQLTVTLMVNRMFIFG